MKDFIISDLDTAIDVLIASKNDDFDINNVIVSENLNLHIKLEGEQWNGYVDYKIAKFITKLQEDFINAYNFQTGNNLPCNEHTIDMLGVSVNVEIKKGCTELFVVATEALKKMTGKQAVGTIITVALITAGTIGYIKYTDKTISQINADRDIQIRKLEHLENLKDKEAIQQSIESLYKLASVNQTAMPYLAKTMKADDKMSVNDSDMISAEGARKLFKSSNPKSDNQDFPKMILELDSNYLISSIDLNKSIILIKHNGTSLPFSLGNLSIQEKEDFYKRCALATKDGINTEIAVMLSAVFQNGKFIEGFVQGVDKKRETAKTIDEAINLSRSLK